MLDLQKLEEKCINLVLQNGKLLIEKKPNVKIAKLKEADEICTNLDLEIEKNILKTLKKDYPNHNFVCEECGKTDKRSKYTWYIDPIDGTKNYIKGLPLFNISIALAENDEVIFGLVYNPLTHELFYAMKNQGAKIIRTNFDHLFMHEEIERINVSTNSILEKSFLNLELPKKNIDKFEEKAKKIYKLIKKVDRIRSFGSSALSLCYTAMGAFDAYIDLNNSTRAFDVAAGSFIIQEAGGRISDLEGNPFTLSSKNLIASNGLIHDEIINTINS